MSDPELLAREQRELDALGARIERLVRDPDAITFPFTRVTAPVIRALKWQPALATEALEALVTNPRALAPGAALAGARRELEANLTRLERAQVVYGTIPFAYAAWLHRVREILLQAARGAGQDGEWSRRRLGHAARVDLEPPLLARAPDELVHVGAIDPLIRAAEAERTNLERRRRLLEAARELLLDAGAALAIDGAALASRREHIARSLTRIGRYQAAGLDPDVDLVHQLRLAAERGDSQRLHAALSALDEFAVAAGDRELGRLTAQALDGVWRRGTRFAPSAQTASLARSGVELFNPSVRRAIEASHEAKRGRIELLRRRADADELSHDEVDQAERFLATDGVTPALRAALAVDGCFDVGGVLSPVRVVERQRRRRLVDFPTSHLVLSPARGPEDLPRAVIEDPRTVLLALATGRLLARRYALDEIREREHVLLRGEVRVYVLDGSTSMLGPRARMRDAILAAELATLIARKNDPRRGVEPVLYYRYFTRELGGVTCVRSEPEALDAITEVLSRVHIGGTDIEQALLSSFELIAGSIHGDQYLARAQVVLVTDGEAPVDADRILEARKRLGGLPIGISIIALGQENPALRSLAARQRSLGERVFYQYIGDRELEDHVEGRSAGPAIHAPPGFQPSAAISELVEEIGAHERRYEAEGLARARDHRLALEELELSPERDLDEGERARFEARARDERALALRFQRWFGRAPARPPEPEALLPPAGDARDLELLETLLDSVVEVVDLVGSDAPGRTADAIEIFERLLLDAGMPPGRYLELSRRYPGRLEPVLARLRRVAEPEP